VQAESRRQLTATVTKTEEGEHCSFQGLNAQ